MRQHHRCLPANGGDCLGQLVTQAHTRIEPGCPQTVRPVLTAHLCISQASRSATARTTAAATSAAERMTITARLHPPPRWTPVPMLSRSGWEPVSPCGVARDTASSTRGFTPGPTRDQGFRHSANAITSHTAHTRSSPRRTRTPRSARSGPAPKWVNASSSLPEMKPASRRSCPESLRMVSGCLAAGMAGGQLPLPCTAGWTSRLTLRRNPCQ